MQMYCTHKTYACFNRCKLWCTQAHVFLHIRIVYPCEFHFVSLLAFANSGLCIVVNNSSLWNILCHNTQTTDERVYSFVSALEWNRLVGLIGVCVYVCVYKPTDLYKTREPVTNENQYLVDHWCECHTLHHL